MELFRFENVTKCFSEKFVLEHLSFEINSGDKIHISGNSGIGKSTIFKLLLGFEQPDSGIIYFNGNRIHQEKTWQIRRKVAYVSQDLHLGHGCVRNFFNETLSYKCNSSIKATQECKINEFLSIFELSQAILENQLEDLSGGEKQRIAIVNALLLDRNIFFLDEITSSLDRQLKEKTLGYFLDKKEFTVVFISHDSYNQRNSHVKELKLSHLQSWKP